MRKNGKTRETVLSMAGTLAAIGIGCAVFVPERFRAHAWLLIIGICMVFLWELWKEKQTRRTERERERTMQIVDLEPDYKNLFAQQTAAARAGEATGEIPGGNCCTGRKGNYVYCGEKKGGLYPGSASR